MKKYLAIILGAVFVLGFAASAFAIHAEIPAETQAVIAKGQTQITIGGGIRVRGFFETNNQDFNDNAADNLSLYETRIDLNVHAKITPNTEAMIWIRDTKTLNGDDDMTWGHNGAGAGDSTGIYRRGGEVAGFEESGLNILQAWIQHTGSGLLGIPAGIKVGHMPLALGNALFFSHTKNGDDAVLLFANPTKELHVALLDVKFREGNARRSDDADGYVGLFAYNTKEFGLSGDVSYVDHQNTFLEPAISGADAHLWNFALRGNTNLGGFMLKGDVEVQTGSIENIPNAADIDFKGWAGLIGASYKLAPVTLSLEYAYGSGSEAGDTDFKDFVSALDNTVHYSWIYEYRTVSASGIAQGGIANTQYVKARLGADLAKDLSGYLDFFWLRANENRVVTIGGVPTLGNSKEVGWEIDWYAKYKIDRNLTWFVEGGYLFAGDFYKTAQRDPDNPWAIRHGIQLSF